MKMVQFFIKVMFLKQSFLPNKASTIFEICTAVYDLGCKSPKRILCFLKLLKLFFIQFLQRSKYNSKQPLQGKGVLLIAY